MHFVGLFLRSEPSRKAKTRWPCSPRWKSSRCLAPSGSILRREQGSRGNKINKKVKRAQSSTHRGSHRPPGSARTGAEERGQSTLSRRIVVVSFESPNYNTNGVLFAVSETSNIFPLGALRHHRNDGRSLPHFQPTRASFSAFLSVPIFSHLGLFGALHPKEALPSPN